MQAFFYVKYVRAEQLVNSKNRFWIRHKNGSGCGCGAGSESFPFLKKVLSGLKYWLQNKNLNTIIFVLKI
jgi:hypothetical protein